MELAKEIYQDFYKSIVDNYIIESGEKRDENECFFKLTTNVQISTKDETTLISWPNGTTYEGSLLRNQLHGKGVLTFPNHSKYDGDFENGRYNGHGVFTNHRVQLFYEGDFINGLPHGKGILRIGEFDVFEGEFDRGRKTRGTHTYQSGVFVGEFDHDQSRKHGKYYFNENKSVYTGSFHKGLPHGMGQLEWKKCDSSENSFLTTVPEKFNGCWKNGKRHGLGILQWNKMSLVTVWENDLKNGSGLMIARNGDAFVSHQMFDRDQYLNARKILLNHEKVILLQKIFGTKHFEIDYFHKIIGELSKGSIDVPDVSPFHLPDYQIELNTTPIYSFISNTLGSKGIQTNPEQELKSINQAIIDQYFNLREIYDVYATLGSSNKNTKYVMNRLGLWQFLQDLELDSESFNVSDVISASETEFQIFVLNQNDFGEPVYFCNFLKYLLYLTTLLNEEERNQNCAIKVKPQFFGYFATMFVIFMRHVLTRLNPISKGMIFKKILENDRNLHKFLMLCSKLTEKMNIRTAFQCLMVLKGGESNVNQFWNSEYKTPKLFQPLSFDDFYDCAKKVFPKMTTKEAHGMNEEKTLITNSTFNITPIEFYQLFEAVVTVAIKKRKIEALKEVK